MITMTMAILEVIWAVEMVDFKYALYYWRGGMDRFVAVDILL